MAGLNPYAYLAVGLGIGFILGSGFSVLSALVTHRCSMQLLRKIVGETKEI